MTTSHSSGCGCHGTRSTIGGSAYAAATLPIPVLHSEAIGGGPVPPMEMLGSTGGVTVIDPASVLTRLWWFDGRFLRAEGFRVDQDYVRNLVAVSNQAVGTGVVSGFDADLLGATTIRVAGGLALAPSGRVVLLPSAADLSIAELVARSTGVLDPAAASGENSPSGSAGAGHADFAPCPPDEPAGPDQGVAPTALYVLTVASAEALCGEEERFGQLCGDACATDADRSVAVEGVRFRLRPITLTLPTSTRVPFSSLHLRSRVASAYYAAERRAVPSMISGAGLRQPVWCSGAEAIGGEEIPLAVLDRAGGITSFVDEWTARRELVETTPQRYWQWRMSMRPLDVFLAQVLQFQCELASLPAGTGPTLVGDPCAAQRTVLGDVNALLGGLDDDAGHGAVLDKLQELRERVADVLSGALASTSGSLLIDHGLVSTPSAGYLPVDPRQDVRAQVRAWFGPGVDLRFCAVRHDFVPEAFQEAQHMERISLTQGIDDRAALEEVDVLVPDGIFAQAATDSAFTGHLELLPQLLGGGSLARVESAAIGLSAVARDQVGTGWSWTLAAYGEASPALGIENFATAMAAAVAAPAEAESPDVYREELSNLESARTDHSFRVLREGSLARARLAGAEADDYAVEPDERRPMVAWVDLETAAPLDGLEVASSTTIRVRMTTYSRARTNPFLIDVGLTGTLTVRGRLVAPGGEVRIETDLDGVIDLFASDDDGPMSRSVRGSTIVWRLEQNAAGAHLLGVDLGLVADGGDPTVFSAAFSETGSPRRVAGRVGRGAVSGSFLALRESSSDLKSPIAAVTLDEGVGVLDLGTSGRDLATSVIDVLGTALAKFRHETSFADQARARLLPSVGSTGVLATSADWVMFHRRRNKFCGDPIVTPKPTRVLRYRWLHSIVDASRFGEVEAVRLSAAIGSAEMLEQILKRYPPQTVGTVEFEEGTTQIRSSVPDLRSAWSTTDRGESMGLAFTGRWGAGEGPTVEGGRLEVAINAVSDMIDTTHHQSLLLAAVPGELETEGSDGVFVTVGAAVEESTAEIVVVGYTRAEQLRDFLSQDRTREELDMMFQELEITSFLAKFAGDDLKNADDLEQWWSGYAVKQVEIVYDRALVPGSQEAAAWVADKYPAIAGALALPDTPDNAPTAPIDLGGPLTLLMVSTPDLDW